MSRIRFLILALALTLGAALLSPLAAAFAAADDEVTVIGWVAVGYDENNLMIGRGKWYQDKADAEAEAAKMRKVDTTTGKYYARVEVEKEPRTLKRNEVEKPVRPPENLRLPSVPKPGGGGGAARMEDLLKGKWDGFETASDTTAVRFEFEASGRVFAYDNHATWSGTWRSVTGKTVVIELTSPHRVNYSVTVSGSQLSGKAHRPGQRGEWSIRLTKR